ncbi:MAG: sulfate ABC transporter substrate-binding protein [Alphaproteobacteria bacterium]|nr:sulfate ABC transporter substrate-binding protein [Alphaproteobacteria bacterium]
MRRFLTFFTALAFALLGTAAWADSATLLNVSYDPTREFYQEYNAMFMQFWKEKTGLDVSIRQSHGGSGKQARAVIDGLNADVVTLALAYDIDVIARETGKIPNDWQKKLPHGSTPYTSTIVFVVRKGNPKGIKDWGDLIKPGVQVITPNPKTSGGARWNYLAALGYAQKISHGNDAAAQDFMKTLFQHVPVLDTGARGAAITFVQRNIGDVLLTWENEAYLAVNEMGKDKLEIVIPSVSILAEPPVAVVVGNASKDGSLAMANAYLDYLYSPEAQALAAKHYYRPTDEHVAAQYQDRFPKLSLMTIMDFGGWQEAQAKHFADGGTFDKIYGR